VQQLHSRGTEQLPLLHRAVLAAARAVPAATALSSFVSNAAWVDDAAADHDLTGAGSSSSSSSSEHSPRLSSLHMSAGADPQYDAAQEQYQLLQQNYETKLQQLLDAYANRTAHVTGHPETLASWQQQDVPKAAAAVAAGHSGSLLIVQQASLQERASGSLALAVAAPPSFLHWVAGQEPSPMAAAAINHLLLPGHLLTKYEVANEGSLHSTFQAGGSLPAQGPAAAVTNVTADSSRGRQKASRRKAKGQASAGVSSSGAGQGTQKVLLLHVHVSELQHLGQQLQLAAREVAGAAAAALSAAAEEFLRCYSLFQRLVGSVAELDVQAGFSRVVRPGSVDRPAGGDFCRPRFAAAAATVTGAMMSCKENDGHSTSSGDNLGGVMSPALQLQGLWHPLLTVTGSSSAAGSRLKSVKANDVLLGGSRPGTMLLTGS